MKDIKKKTYRKATRDVASSGKYDQKNWTAHGGHKSPETVGTGLRCEYNNKHKYWNQLIGLHY